MMPRPIGEARDAKLSLVIEIPAFPSAKIGMIRKADQGDSLCSHRCSGWECWVFSVPAGIKKPVNTPATVG